MREEEIPVKCSILNFDARFIGYNLVCSKFISVINKTKQNKTKNHNKKRDVAESGEGEVHTVRFQAT